MSTLEKTVVYARPTSNGDGSASIRYYLSRAIAEATYEEESEPFAEDGIEPVETYIGSNVHREAVEGYE